jgi:hypothetical protein
MEYATSEVLIINNCLSDFIFILDFFKIGDLILNKVLNMWLERI